MSVHLAMEQCNQFRFSILILLMKRWRPLFFVSNDFLPHHFHRQPPLITHSETLWAKFWFMGHARDVSFHREKPCVCSQKKKRLTEIQNQKGIFTQTTLPRFGGSSGNGIQFGGKTHFSNLQCEYHLNMKIFRKCLLICHLRHLSELESS